MTRSAIAAAALLLLWPSTAQAQPEASLHFANRQILPETLRLRAGEATRLRLVNRDDETHEFEARALFSRVALDEGTRERLRGGRIRIAAGETIEMTIVPRRGRYTVRCTERFHSTMGEEGRILVR